MYTDTLYIYIYLYKEYEVYLVAIEPPDPANQSHPENLKIGSSRTLPVPRASS